MCLRFGGMWLPCLLASQDKLGLMYLQGKGTPKDAHQAAEWFKKAAQQDFAQAQYHLAQLYAKGERVKKDKVEAIFWFKKACENGYQPSCSQYQINFP